MDFDIYFCADGVLRAKFSDKTPMIPMDFLHKKSNFKTDLSFWVRWWEQNVFFEKGLTVSKFLMCLEPWSDFWSEITLKNVKSYIDESKKPTLVSDESSLDWVNVSFYTEAEVNMEYAHDDDEDELMERDFNAWINAPKKARLTGNWDVHSAYKITGYKNGQEEHYSVEHTPMNELANLPIFLDENQTVIFYDYKMERFFQDGKEHVFKDDAFGVCRVEKTSGYKYLVGKKYHKMRDVVEGFFWWMYSEPTKRDDFNSFLKESVAIAKEDYEGINVEEKTSESINVINFPGMDSESEKDSSEDKKLKVAVSPGAFDSMIASHERDKNYWEDMLTAVKKDRAAVIKIGKVEVAQSSEKRMFGKILADSNDGALPRGTDFRLI